ncbi:hypothetical protein ACLOJK_004013 [Asimina triloba]
MFARSEDLQYVRSVFERMIERNVVVWTLMITRLTQCGSAKDAVDLFIEMEVSGFIPDQFALSSAISACTELGIIQPGQQLHSHAILAGLISVASVGCSPVNMYVNCAVDGSVDASMRVFDQMLMHDVMSWTAIITGYVQSGGRDKEAIELFCSMKQEGVQPNQFTFSSVLKACANLSDADLGDQVYAQVVKSGLASVNCVGNSFVAMYTHSGRMEDARKIFDLLLEKNLISYNIMVDGYTKNLDSEEAFELLQQIEDAGVGPCAFTFASLLSAAARIGALGKGTLKVVVYDNVGDNVGNIAGMGSDLFGSYAESSCTSTLEQEAYPALDELSSKVSTSTLERKVRDELDHLLDDDMDMAEMYLTDKLAQRPLDETSSRDKLDDDEFELTNEMDEDSKSKCRSFNESSVLVKPDIQELEMLLEAYFVQPMSPATLMPMFLGKAGS